MAVTVLDADSVDLQGDRDGASVEKLVHTAALLAVMRSRVLTTIGNCAFLGCTSITTLTLPDGLTTIGNHAFNGCTSIATLTLPDGLTTIGDGAFYD